MQNKVILITGSNGEIGQALIKKFIKSSLNQIITIDLKKSRLNYQSLKIGKILESDNKQFVKQRIDKMIQDLDFCITNLSS